jgi:hypothetical protein
VAFDEAIADQRGRHAVAAPDLEDAVVRPNVERVHDR